MGWPFPGRWRGTATTLRSGQILIVASMVRRRDWLMFSDLASCLIAPDLATIMKEPGGLPDPVLRQLPWAPMRSEAGGRGVEGGQHPGPRRPRSCRAGGAERPER